MLVGNVNCFKIHPRFMSDYKTHLTNFVSYLFVSITQNNLFLPFPNKILQKPPKELKLKILNGKQIQGPTWKVRSLEEVSETHTYSYTISSNYCNIIPFHTTYNTNHILNTKIHIFSPFIN